ncbi:uncharacterized protein EI90DRAFT_1880329 [Cantharellus anzutake]|uniref:uncharacterized protein n=1 Tax=Cantharellus anzutake TaxID=1750568 RepID=UPI001906F172|nr:uncharacterized protein EI90DRAFT_1880329 [Cantharellus anzutake]KAF8326855.1 hypothetical protein EI90DRAFT_1880329 [Cantharellus anzutake]
MEKLPIEIVSEICSHLGPPDLLHLVRSAKNFAQYLLRPSAAGVWKAAREECALDMPPIHPDLTEQKYAFLGFGSTCQNCGSITRSAVDWYLRRRWCSACQEIVIESEYCDLNRKWNQLIEDKRQRWKHDAIIHQNWVSVHEGRARRQYRSFLACPISEYNAFLLKAQELTDKEWKVYVAEQQEKKEALTMVFGQFHPVLIFGL